MVEIPGQPGAGTRMYRTSCFSPLLRGWTDADPERFDDDQDPFKDGLGDAL